MVPVVTGGLTGTGGTTGGTTPNGVVPVVKGGLVGAGGTGGKFGCEVKSGYVMGTWTTGGAVPGPGGCISVGRSGRSGGASPGRTPDVAPGWPGLGTFDDGGVGIPNMLVPGGVPLACCGPWVPALLPTGSSVMEVLNGGALIPDVLSAGTPWLPPPGVVLVCGTRSKRYPPNVLVS